MEQPPRQAQLLQTGGEAHVVADVVADVPATKESRLHDVHDVIERALQAVGHDQHDQLGITIEEGDGAVTGELRGRLALLGYEADDATEERGKRLDRFSRLEGMVEHLEKDWQHDPTERAVELIGQAIIPRAGTTCCHVEG